MVVNAVLCHCSVVYSFTFIVSPLVCAPSSSHSQAMVTPASEEMWVKLRSSTSRLLGRSWPAIARALCSSSLSSPIFSSSSFAQPCTVVRGALLAKESDSSFAEAHREFLSEPTHIEDEEEDQEDEVEDGKDCEV